MKTEVHYFHVSTPDASFTFLGGPSSPADNGDVWLTNPSGEHVLKVPASCVRRSNREETARRIVETRIPSKAPLN